MRKTVTMVLLVLMLLSVGLTSAQENTLIFDLSDTFFVQDLGFTFSYPAGWVHDTSSGITLAENDADLAAEIDDDDTTNAVGYTITLNGAPLTAIGLENTSSLDEVVDTLVGIAGITVTERFDTVIGARRGITVTGVDGDGEPGLATLWTQDGFVVLFGMGVPVEVGVTQDNAYTFDFMLGSITPELDVELTESYELPDGASLSYPAGWIAGEDEDLGIYFAELQSDVDAALADLDVAPEGRVVTTGTIALADLGLTETPTADEVYEILLSVEWVSAATNREEVVVDGLPGASYDVTRVNDSGGEEFLNLVIVPAEAEIWLVISIAGSAEARDAQDAVFYAMLASVTSDMAE